MENKKVKKIITCAIFAALICVTALFVSVPAPIVGNINLGDAVILVNVWMLGPIGAISAAIGASLADLISAYAIYAPATFIIKAVMAIVCFFIFKSVFSVVKRDLPSRIISAACAELVMTAGYFIYEFCLYGFKTAFANITFNVIQGVTGAIAGTIFITLSIKNKTVNKYIESLK